MAEKKLPSIKQRKIIEVNNRIAVYRSQLQVFEKAGLRKGAQAKELVRLINESIAERDELFAADERERRDCVAHLLLCIAAADFACEAGNMLADVLKRTYGKLLVEQEDLIGLLQGVAKDMGGLVLLIDRAKDDRFSLNFAAMSDEMTDTMTSKCLAEALEIVRRHDNADNGHNIRFKKRG